VEGCVRWVVRGLDLWSGGRWLLIVLARWESCGIPSSWHRPTTRLPGGSIPAHRRSRLPGLPPGSRVVALGEVGEMPHPAHTTEPGSALVSAIPEARPPGEGMFVGDHAAFADVAPLREL
jgi:hypothetical protein